MSNSNGFSAKYLNTSTYDVTYKTEKMNRPKIGLALGSGGARGLAHIGILSVLLENNIPIDYIAGVSAGSIVGAYYALNLEIESMEDKVKKLTKRDMLKLIDPISPKKALIAGNRIKAFIKDLVTDKLFSDTKIPLSIIATDFCSGEEVIIRQGNITDAVRASISIPGIFPPVKLNSRMLFDGGIVNPTPIDVVKSMGADIVIAVDLTMKKPIKIENPTIVETLMQAYEILRMQSTRFNIAKMNQNIIIIQPNLIGRLDSYKFYNNDFIEEGKSVARRQLPRIKRLLQNKI